MDPQQQAETGGTQPLENSMDDTTPPQQQQLLKAEQEAQQGPTAMEIALIEGNTHPVAEQDQVPPLARNNVGAQEQPEQQQQYPPSQLIQQSRQLPKSNSEPLKEGIYHIKTHDENTETFRWVIQGASLSKESLYSEPFEVGGYKWQMYFFPKGNKVPHHISVYLAVAGAKELPVGWSRYAQFGLSVVNFDDASQPFENESEHRFNAMESDWGFREFTFKDRIYDPNNGFFRNGTLVLEATVKVRKEAHLTNPANYNSKRETGFVGLRNQGATCYLNSLLQTLYHIPEFRRGVYRMPTEDCDNPAKSIPLALQRVFWRLQFTESAVDTKELTQSFGWDTIDSFMQHDVQELARVLCDNLEEKMKNTAVEGTIPRLFKGEIKNYIKCVNIDFESTRTEAFYDLQLNVKGCASIYDSFDKYIEPEMLEGDNRYAAEGHGLQDAKKGSIFTKLPPVLMLHLKRFEYDFQRDAMYKINDHYQFDLQIDLNKYVENPAENSNLYRLFSVLVHSGDVSGGHYYAFVHAFDNKDHWYKFDDDKVFHVLEKDATEENFGGDETRSHIFPHKTTNLPFKRFSNAYMLVYIKTSEVQQILKPVADEEVPTHLRTRFEKEKNADEQRRRDKAEAHKYIHFRLVTDNDLGYYEGVDLSPPDGQDEYRLLKSACPSDLKQQIAEKLKVPPSCQRLWKYEARQNRTVRPDAPIRESHDNLPFEKLYHTTPHAADHLQFYLETPPGYIPIDELTDESSSDESEPMQVDTTSATPELVVRGSLLPLTNDAILVFFKYFDPTIPLGRHALRYVGSHVFSSSKLVKDLFPIMRALAKLPESEELLVFEEVKPTHVDRLDPNAQLKASEIQHGDIIVFQRVPSPEENGLKLQLASDYYSYLFNRRTVRFSPLNDADPSHEIPLELQKNMTFDEVVCALADTIRVPSAFIRLTGCNPLHNTPRSAPFKTTDIKTLKDMLHAGQGASTDRLFFEVLQIPLRELESKRSLQVSWFNSKVEEVAKVNLLLHKESTVAQLVEALREELRRGGHLSDANVPIRIMEIWQHRITRMFPLEERIDSLCTPTGFLRAEEMSEDTEAYDYNKGDRFVQANHFCKDVQGQPRQFGHPFCITVHRLDTGADVRKFVQQKLAVPDEEFEHWKLALLRFTKIEYIPDEENVSEIIRKYERFRPEMYLGFEHKDTSSSRTTTTRWYDKAIKIYN